MNSGVCDKIFFTSAPQMQPFASRCIMKLNTIRLGSTCMYTFHAFFILDAFNFNVWRYQAKTKHKAVWC